MQGGYVSITADQRCTRAKSRFTLATQSDKESDVSMSKLLATLATVKAILIAASVAFARGDMLPVILISILFNLAQLGAKPVGQAVPRDTIVASRSHDDGC
jgi:Na+/H+-dicarboxylate symporter